MVEGGICLRKDNIPKGAKSTLMGHDIYFNDVKGWLYLDGISVKENRPCIKCNQKETKDGHDPCISNLPGVINACCGHGKEGYIKFKNELLIRGIFTEIREAAK